jgi:hypothetical protein
VKNSSTENYSSEESSRRRIFYPHEKLTASDGLSGRIFLSKNYPIAKIYPGEKSSTDFESALQNFNLSENCEEIQVFTRLTNPSVFVLTSNARKIDFTLYGSWKAQIDTFVESS